VFGPRSPSAVLVKQELRDPLVAQRFYTPVLSVSIVGVDAFRWLLCRERLIKLAGCHARNDFTPIVFSQPWLRCPRDLVPSEGLVYYMVNLLAACRASR